MCSGEELRVLIAPFIQSAALLNLIEDCGPSNSQSIITRWNAADIATGVSDIEIYPMLKDKGIALYIHQSIHLKLFIFESNWAFVTSSNITGKGLGISGQGNVEVGCRAELGSEDWRSIYDLLGASVRVDDEIYQKAKDYRDANAKKPKALPELHLTSEQNQPFSILSLPAIESPSELHELYASIKPIPAEIMTSYYHDMTLYKVPLGLDKDKFYVHLGNIFIGQPFIKAIASLIKEAKSAPFGLVNKWLQANCSDKPTPYRWELKPATRRLYNWMDFFFDEIKWDVPGQHSQVIFWNEK